jgi:23S rRNA pseudouridine2605 synthase
MMRIQKYLSEQGICSRREAEDFIRRGLVAVNGSVVREMGVQIDPEKDTVTLLQDGLQETRAKETVIVHKPRGIVCSRNSNEGKTIFDLLPQYKHLNVVGRLDKESDGLILLSNDGVITRRITGREHEVEKEYEVTTQENLAPNKILPFRDGIMLDDGPTLPADVHFINQHKFHLTLREGRNHQIRRMCEYAHLTVVNLTRLRIGNLTLKKLQPGQSRPLTPQEVASLRTPAK